MSQVYSITGSHQGLPLGQLAVRAGCTLHHFLDHFPTGVNHSANAQPTAQQSQGLPSSTVEISGPSWLLCIREELCLLHPQIAQVQERGLLNKTSRSYLK